MKKIYALAAAAMVALGMNAQNGAPLYATGDGAFEGGSWAPETADQFKYADGKYTMTVADLASFKISTVQGDWDTFNAAALTCSYGYVPDVAVPLVPGDGNIKCPAKSTWTITVAGDLSTVTLHTDEPITIVPPYDLTLYLRGGMNDWGAPEEWALTQLGSDAEGNWVYTYVCNGTMIDAGTEFKIAAAEWADMNIGAGDDNIVPLYDAEFLAFRGDNPTNFVMEETFSGAMFLQINFETYEGHVLFSNDDEEECPYPYNPGGVANVASENVAPVYYNLQGVQVVNPENGFYIVRRGNKVTKEIIR